MKTPGQIADDRLAEMGYADWYRPYLEQVREDIIAAIEADRAQRFVHAHGEDWELSFSEDSTPDSWWIDLDIGHTDQIGLTADFIGDATVTFTSVEAEILAQELLKTIEQGRKEFNDDNEE